MTRVRVIGRQDRLDAVLECLYGLRAIELEAAAREPDAGLEPVPLAERAARADRLRLVLAELDSLLALVPAPAEAPTLVEGVDVEAVRGELAALAPCVEALAARLEELRAEEIVLGRHVTLLRRLLELVPELAALDEELAALRLGTTALVLGTGDPGIVELLGDELEARLGRRFSLVWTAVDRHALGCVLLFPLDAAEDVQELLGQERVRHVPLPEAYRGLSLRGAVDAMDARLGLIPADLAAAQTELDALLRPRAAGWRAARAGLQARLEQVEAVRLAGATERTFVVAGWVPRPELPRLRAELGRALGGEVVVEELGDGRADAGAPVLMRNPAPARPFEFVVRFLDVPRARSLDPTGLVAVFLPLMFGLMVGDVVYGALLLAAALAVRARYGARSPVVRDASRILAVGSGWAVVFGVLFGEALGDLGAERLGMPVFWLRRDDADALEPLLLLALAIGAAHVTLGLLLGLWQSARDRSGRGLLDRAGTLLVLGGVFALAGVAADRLPEGTITPAVAACVIGIVVVSAAHGWLGAMLGPLELIGTLGNVLSYLRLAAVGLASVYLAVVANELAAVGPIWMGVIVASFLHALNLVLAGFTPAIQALRLHYVEFFGKFYVGGGRAFRPFGGNLAKGE